MPRRISKKPRNVVKSRTAPSLLGGPSYGRRREELPTNRFIELGDIALGNPAHRLFTQSTLPEPEIILLPDVSDSPPKPSPVPKPPKLTLRKPQVPKPPRAQRAAPFNRPKPAAPPKAVLPKPPKSPLPPRLKQPKPPNVVRPKPQLGAASNPSKVKRGQKG